MIPTASTTADASLPAGLAVMSRRGAWIAFGCLVVISPWRARIEIEARRTGTVYGDYTDFLLFVSELALLATLALWGASLLLDHRPVRTGPRFIAWPVAAVLVLGAAGIPLAHDVALAAYTEVHLVALAALGLFVLNEAGRLERLRVPVALMATAQAIVGIGQVVGQRSLGWSGLGEHDLAPSLPVSVVTAKDGTRYLRAYGLSDHPNILGGLLAFALLFLGGTMAVRGGRPAAWTVASFALGSAALFVTFSRSAWIALVIGLAVITAMLVGRRDRLAVRQLAGTCAVGALAVAPFIAPFREVLSARTGAAGPIVTESRSVDERGALSDATVDVIGEHPALGVGLGSLPLAMRDDRPDFRYAYQPASVVLLDVTAETGVAGGLAYAALLTAPWVLLVRRRGAWTSELAVASGLLAAVTVVGFFDYYTWTYSSGRLWAWIVLGLWLLAYSDATAGSPEDVRVV